MFTSWLQRYRSGIKCTLCIIMQQQAIRKIKIDTFSVAIMELK